MLLKLGVSIERLKRPIRRSLTVIDNIFKKYDGIEAVITSTYEGTHMPSSLHYDDNAIDLRKSPVNSMNIVEALKKALGISYQIVLESDHIHLEYDPKGKE